MNPLQNIDTLLFDMDGTLTDLGTRWWQPFFRVFDKLKPNFDKTKRKEIFETILNSIIETSMGSSRILKIKTFLKARKALDLSLVESFKALKLLKSDPLAFKEVVPLDGVSEILETLRSRGYRLALVTNAGDKTVNNAKNSLKILNSFDILVTRNTVKHIKPYPDSLLFVCEKLSIEPERCVIIGDFPQDIQAGKNAGIKTIAVLGVNGKYTKKRILQMKPDIILPSIHELTQLFPCIQ